MKNKLFGNEQVDIEKNKKEQMVNEIGSICSDFVDDNDIFDEGKVIKKLKKYIENYDRILYSEVSKFYYELNETVRPTFINNVDQLLEHTVNHPTDILQDNIVDKVVLKMWDHVQLAAYQCGNLMQTDADFENKFKNNIQPIRDDINKEQQGFMQTMHAQLISLVGIFTAMSFLVFGGINTLDNIFSGAKTLPVLKVMIIGSVWGLCISNLVFIFMFFISKMTELNIKSNQSAKANLVQKYPLVIWANFVIFSILSFSSLAYFLCSKGFLSWIWCLNVDHAISVSIVSFVVVMILLLVLGFCILRSYGRKT